MDLLLLTLKQIQISSLEYPWALLLLLALPVYMLIAYLGVKYVFYRVKLPSTHFIDQTGRFESFHPGMSLHSFKRRFLLRSYRFWAGIVSIALFSAFYVCLTIALAHPYGGATNETLTEGIDIYFSLDMSASMKAYDYSLDEMQARYRLDVFTPNRFEVARKTILDFVDTRAKRCNHRESVTARCDRIGVAMFGQRAFIDVPLTRDYANLSSHLAKRRIDDIDASQSAIGDGILIAVASLRHSPAKSKNIILISDGDRKGGRVSIGQAIAAAKNYGIQIYPIMIGSGDNAVIAQSEMGGYTTFYEAQLPVNFELLNEIAAKTNGQAYKASTDAEFMSKLNDILEQLEPNISSEVEQDNLVDLSLHFVLLGFIFAFIASLVYMTAVRQYP